MTDPSALSVQDLAEAAGVDAAAVRQLIELGILSTDADGRLAPQAARRVRIMQGLERGGLPVAGIAEAIRLGELSLDFVDQASYERFGGLSEMTFRDASEATGVPIEPMLQLREAMGLAPAEPGDRLRDDELGVLPLMRFWHEHRFRPAVIHRSLRTLARSMGQVAETEADAFRTEILAPLASAGFVDLAAATAEFDIDFPQATDQAILAVYHAQQANAWMRNIFEAFEAALARAGLHERLDHPPAISFLDLTGYTRLTDERGDEAAAELAAGLERLVQQAASRHAGKAVKFLGDGVMFWFRDPGAAVRASLEMVDGARSAGLPPAHVGVHAGPVLFQGGDYFGRTVNVAARIADYARQGEVVVSQEVVDAASDADVSFVAIGPVELKGVSGPVVLHVAGGAS